MRRGVVTNEPEPSRAITRAPSKESSGTMSLKVRALDVRALSRAPS